MGKRTEHTPGPWRWFANAKSKTIYLATPDRGRLYVMGFERWGMQQAAPQFRNPERCVLQHITELGEPDHNGDFTINHPDAILIASAPALAAENQRLREALQHALPVLEDAASADPHCLGKHDPPSPDEHGWFYVHEMIGRFTKALTTKEGSPS